MASNTAYIVKVMKNNYLEIYRSGRFLSLLIVFLGFPISCTCGDELPAPMYGSPSAYYQIKAKVVDLADVPIPNIRVIFNGADTTKRTDNQGHSEFKFVYSTSHINGSFEDTDGQLNGGQYVSIKDSCFVFDQNQYTLYHKDQGSDWLRSHLNAQIKVVMHKQQ